MSTSVQEAREALEQAELAFKNARRGIAIAGALARQEPNLQNAEAVRKAREAAEAHELLVGVRREALEAAEKVEAEAQRAEAGRELELLLDELESERHRLGEFLSLLVEARRQAQAAVEFCENFAVQDDVRVEAAKAKAEQAGRVVDLAKLDLGVILAAANLHLVRHFPRSATPEEAFAPGGLLARAIGHLASARTYAQAADGLAHAANELAADVGSTPQDWLALAPHPRPGTTAGERHAAAAALLDRYCFSEGP